MKILDETTKYLRVTNGDEDYSNYMIMNGTTAKQRLSIEQGGAVYGVLTREDKEQLDRIEHMLEELMKWGVEND